MPGDTGLACLWCLLCGLADDSAQEGGCVCACVHLCGVRVHAQMHGMEEMCMSPVCGGESVGFVWLPL